MQCNDALLLWRVLTQWVADRAACMFDGGLAVFSTLIPIPLSISTSDQRLMQ